MDHEFLHIEPPRSLTSEEEGILHHLLSINFQGRDELLKQAQSARVVEECKECPSIAILVDKIPEHSAPVKHRVPIQAQTVDSDGVVMHVLLHVVHGFIDEIEIYRVDLQSVKKLPQPNSLEFMELDSN